MSVPTFFSKFLVLSLTLYTSFIYADDDVHRGQTQWKAEWQRNVAQPYDFFQEQQELHLATHEELDLNTEQTRIAKQIEEEYKSFDIISHQIYANERIRFFNFTAFSQKDLKNKLGTGSFHLDDIQNLNITLGYGMEYYIKPTVTIGYEYLSSFPYDRGQLVRVFWNYIF